MNATRADGSVYQVATAKEIRYDLLGRAVEERDVVNGVAMRSRRKEYNEVGLLTTQFDALGNRTDYAYDLYGRRTGMRNALGVVTTTAYDKNHNVIRQGLVRTESGATINHQLQSVQYDDLGRKTKETDALGHSQTWQHDERNNIIESRSAAGIVKQFSYDIHGNKTQELDGLGNTLQWQYSSGSANATDSNAYSFGQLLSKKDLGNNTTTYHYNGFAQLVQEQYGEQTQTRTNVRNYAYWQSGLLKSISDNVHYGVYAGELDGVADYDRTINISTLYYDERGNQVREVYDHLHEWEEMEYNREDFGPEGYTWMELGPFLRTSQSVRETRYSYDALQRLSQVKAPAGNRQSYNSGGVTAEITQMSYEYDELGNRRRIYSAFKEPGKDAAVTDYWYLYDAEGRITLSKGKLQNGNITFNTDATKEGLSVRMQYDALGRRISAETLTGRGIHRENRIGGSGTYVADRWNIYTEEKYSYTDTNLIGQVQKRTVRKEYESNANRMEFDSYKSVSQRGYDASNRQIFSSEYDDNGALKSSSTTTLNADGKTRLQELRDKDGKLTHRVRFDHADSYDAAGNLVHYSYEEGSVQTVPIYPEEDWGGREDGPPQPIGYETKFVASWAYTYKFTHARYDAYKELRIDVTTDREGTRAGYTQHALDARGQITSTSLQENDISIQRSYSYDVKGQILTKTEKKGNEALKAQDYFYAGNNPIANIGSITAAEFDYNYTPVSSTYPSQAPSHYAVNSGDTLASIARAVFGDAKLWYLIADANSLSVGPDEAIPDVHLGKSLKIPNVISNIHNDANTFKPYNPSEIIGDTTPTPIPIPPKQKCKTLTTIISIIVAIVVTYYSGQPAAGAAAGNVAGQALGLMFNGQYDWDEFGNGLARSAGVYGLNKKDILNPLSDHNLDVNNPFSEKKGEHLVALDGMMHGWGAVRYWSSEPGEGRELDSAVWNPIELGAQGKFDRQSVAVSAAAGAAGGYVGGYVAGTWAGAAGGAMVGAAAGYVTAYGMNKAFGREAHFNMREMAASMAAAYLSAELFGGEQTPNNDGSVTTTAPAQVREFSWGNVLQDFATNAVSSGIRYAMNKSFGVKDTHWNGKLAFLEAATYALGSNVTGHLKHKKLPKSVKDAMANNAHAGDEYLRALDKGVSDAEAERYAVRDINQKPLSGWTADDLSEHLRENKSYSVIDDDMRLSAEDIFPELRGMRETQDKVAQWASNYTPTISAPTPEKNVIAPEREFFDFMSLPTVSEQMAFAFDEQIMTPAIENMLQVSHQTDLFVEKLAKFNKRYASEQLGKAMAFEDSSNGERVVIFLGGIFEPTVDGVATLLKGAGNILHDGFDLMQRSTKFAYQVGTYLGEGDTQGALDLVKAGYNEKLTGLFKTIEGFEQRYDEASAMVSLVLQNKRAREALMSSLGQAWEDTSQASMFIQGGGLVIEVALALATSGGSTAATLSNNARRATGLIGDVADAVLSFGKSLRGVKDGVPNKNNFSPLGELGEFETLGLPAVTPTRNVLSDTIEGRMLVRQYRQAGMSEFQALRFARRDIESGASLPSIGLQSTNDTFYKVVPSGNKPGRSSYYLSPDQYSSFKSGYDDIFDNLSLPDGSVADAYDVYKYSVKQGSAPLSFASEIAPSMSSGQGLRIGGFGQTVIPNSNALEMKELIETLNRRR